MQNSTIPPRQARKKRRIWPWVLMALVFCAAAIGGAFFASSGLLDKAAPKAAEKKEELLTAHDKATIMIMGVDERDDDVGRSDTLMIAAIDPKTDRATLLSIPRDTRVKIKGHGYDKINAAYAYGNEKLTQGTVENFLGINIDHYIIINIQAFKKIIDALGGIDIDVEKRMYYEDPWDDDGGLLIDLYPGKQHMDGKTAVTYVRYRDEEGDIGRIRRQQKFMRACMDKIASPAIIPRLPSVVSEIMGSIKTDLSMRQLLEFAGTLKSAQKNGLDAEMVPGRPLYIEGISYWIPEIGKLRMALANTLGIRVDSGLRAKLEREAQEYESSIPASATEVPASDTSIGKAVTSSRIESSSDTERRKKADKDERKERREKAGETRSSEDSEDTSRTEERRDLRREDQADRNLDLPDAAYSAAPDSSETPAADETAGESAVPSRTGTAAAKTR